MEKGVYIMKSVFLVVWKIDYSEDFIDKIFSTYDKAKEYVKKEYTDEDIHNVDIYERVVE
jgi:hypothetical protein